MSDTDPLTWSADTSTADDRSKPGRTLAGAGPVPKLTGAIVVGAIVGLSVLKRVFRGA